MVASVIYRLAGVTPDFARESTADKIASTMEVNRNAESLPISRGLTRTTVNNLEFNFEPVEEEKFVVIEGEELYEIDKQIEIKTSFVAHEIFSGWNLIRDTAQKIKTLSMGVGVAIFVVGIWKSFSDRSSPRALETVFLTCVAAYFAVQARSIENMASAEYKKLQDPTPLIQSIANFRKQVMTQGLSSFASHVNLLPNSIHDRAIEFFSDKEIKDFFKKYIQALIKKPFPELGEQVKKERLFKSLFEKLPRNSYFKGNDGIYSVINSIDQFIENSKSEDNASRRFQSYKKGFENLFKNFKDDDSKKFLSLFNQRFEVASRRLTFNKKDYLNFIGSLLAKELDHICDKPGEVKKFMENEAPEKYYSWWMKAQFNRVFGEVFSEKDLVVDRDAYMEWARTQLTSISEYSFCKNCLNDYLSRENFA